MEETVHRSVYFGFYKLKEPPFSITPDPDFLFFSQSHQNVIEKILYGIHIRAGFILLSGEVGTGKTTICRSIIDTLNAEGEIVYIINPSLSSEALISNVLDDLGIAHSRQASKKDLIDRLNQFLLNRDRHRPIVMIIDDAQTMPVETLEDLRLLSNLETDKEKLIQMLLVGQPEIEDLLSLPEMRQLKQRIIVHCRLEHLKPHEVEGYINRRLFIAGSNGQIQFTSEAKRRIFRGSRGIPRMINKICDFALTAGYLSGEFIIRKKHVNSALRELGDLDFKKNGRGNRVCRRTARDVRGLLLAFALSIGVILVFFHLCLPTQMDTNPQASLSSAEDTSHRNTWVPAYYPFIIQLGTFKTFEQVVRAVSNYTKNGLEIRWNPVDLGKKGRRYRIFTGYFESKTEALAAQKEQRFENSLILFNPWTILVGQSADVKILSSLSSLLYENQYDSYVVKAADHINWLLTGAFATRPDAEKMANELRRFCPSAQVVPR
jgi:general secretion pathway protein A